MNAKSCIIWAFRSNVMIIPYDEVRTKKPNSAHNRLQIALECNSIGIKKNAIQLKLKRCNSWKVAKTVMRNPEMTKWENILDARAQVIKKEEQIIKTKSVLSVIVKT